MRLGPIRLTHRRAVRAVAALVATLLMAGNVLAAAGLCALRAPTEANGFVHAVVEADTPEANPCPQHRADDASRGPSTATHHCPSEDPSAQSRAVDIPAAQFMAAIAALPCHSIDAGRLAEPPVAATRHPEPQPLYARLQRLRL